jgi:molecular chaperone DnaK (HSP70)
MEYHFSIDFGTSNTVISYLNEVSDIKYINDKNNGEILIPSTIYFFKDTINENNKISDLKYKEHYEIGYSANDNYKTYNDFNSYFFQFKRFLGINKSSSVSSFDFIKKYNLKYDIDEELIYFYIPTNNENNFIKCSIIDLVYLYLKSIHLLICDTLNIKNVLNIYITTPAFFNDLQKNQLKTSFKQSNFNVLKIYNEPTSASVYYVNKYYKDLKEDAKFIIFDLGCGTLDITTLLYNSVNKLVEILDVYGNNSLGSLDIDNIIINDIYTKYNIDINNKKWKNKIRQCAEEIKIKMTYINNYDIVLENVPINKNNNIFFLEYLKISYNKNYFNMIISDIVDTIINPLKKIISKNENIIDIVFVGGGSLIELIRTKAQSICKINNNILIEHLLYKTIVSCGSCIMHRIIKNKEDFCLIDIVPSNIAIMGIDKNIINIIPKNSKIPIHKEFIFTTSHDSQKIIDFEICEDDKIIYSYYITGLPALKRGAILIKIVFKIDINGLLNLTIDGSKNTQNGEHSKIDFNFHKNIKLIPKYKMKNLLKLLCNKI